LPVEKGTNNLKDIAVGNQATGTQPKEINGALRMACTKEEEMRDFAAIGIRHNGLHSVAKFFYEYLTLLGKAPEEILFFLIEERILITVKRIV